MTDWRGKWALVTGASAGLGAAFARQLAARGVNLVLTARRQDRLEALAGEVRAAGVAAEVYAADLARPGAAAEIFAFTEARGLEIEILINNAGFGGYGEFHRQPRERLTAMVQVNCAAVTELAHLYLPAMVARRRGWMLVISSAAGFQAVPYITTYAATKAFDLLFAEGLAYELKPYNVVVTALCPGSTHTEFREVAGQPEKTFRVAESAEKVVRVGLDALARGKMTVISGAHNKLSQFSERFAPRALVVRMAGRLFAPPQTESTDELG
jgi:short-subunit dehydrogenase